jgi:hypothetical protein
MSDPHTPVETRPQGKVPCKACGEDMPKRGSCDCGWRRGLALTATVGPDGRRYFGPENPQHKIRNEGLAASVLGVILLLVGVAGGGIGLALVGTLCAVAGVATLTITRMGTVWMGLEGEERAAAWPGRTAGWVPLACVVVWIGLMAFVGNLVSSKR